MTANASSKLVAINTVVAQSKVKQVLNWIIKKAEQPHTWNARMFRLDFSEQDYGETRNRETIQYCLETFAYAKE